MEFGIFRTYTVCMQRFLALDIGNRRTGVAYTDEESAVPVPLATLKHNSIIELAKMVETLISDRSITTLVVGLPLLPSGEEGAQTQCVRDAVAEFRLPPAVKVVFLDERYTTPRGAHTDPDACAACTLLLTHLSRLGLS